jgi:hypothetical protein
LILLFLRRFVSDFEYRDITLVQREAVAAARVGERQVVVVGGRNNSGMFVDVWELFDPSGLYADGVMAHRRAFHTVTTIGEERAFIAGGRNETGYVMECEFITQHYDSLNSKRTVSAQSGPALTFGRCHPRAVRIGFLEGDEAEEVPKGVLVFGGASVECGLEFFNETTGTMEYRECPGQRLRKGILVMCGRFRQQTRQSKAVLFAGGYIQDGIATSEAYLVDVTDFSCVRISPMLMPRWGHSAVELKDGRVLVIGGIGSNGEALFSTEVFDPWQRRFVPGPDLLWAVAEPAAVPWINEFGEEDLVVIIGGRREHPQPQTQVLRYPYDRVRLGPRLRARRCTAQGYLLAGFHWTKQLIVFGPEAQGRVTCEVFDPYAPRPSWIERVGRTVRSW